MLFVGTTPAAAGNIDPYRTPPTGPDLAPASPTSLPPGALTPAWHTHLAHGARELLLPHWGGPIRLTPREECLGRPVYDFTRRRTTAPGSTGE